MKILNQLGFDRLNEEMKPIFRWLFGAWLVLWLASEMYWLVCEHSDYGWCCRNRWAKGIWWSAMAVAFGILEAWGLKSGWTDKGSKGDTLSEVVWKTLTPDWMLYTIGTGAAIALGVRGASIPFLLADIDHPVLIHTPWAALTAGGTVWLILHFMRVPLPRKWQRSESVARSPRS